MFTLKTKFSIAKAVITKNSPFYIQYFITRHCNLNCKMCNVVNANEDIADIPIDDIEKIAKNLVAIGAGIVLLSGGEPFLRKDLPKIIEIFCKHGLSVRLQTNGLTATREKIIDCVSAGVRDVSVSLDSLDEEKQDFINGEKGSWRKAIEAIASFSQILSGKGAICGLGTVLSSYNYVEIPGMLKFATNIGWYVSLVPVHITSVGKPLNFRGTDSSFKIKEKEFSKFDNVFDELISLKKDGYNLFDSYIYLENLKEFIKTGRTSWRKNNTCDSPNLYFVVLPNGEFSPCCDYRFPEKIFLYQDDFPFVYKSKDFRGKTRLITQECKGCLFGSYPEMSILARYYGGFLERVKLYLKASFSQNVGFTVDRLVGMAEEIKNESI